LRRPHRWPCPLALPVALASLPRVVRVPLRACPAVQAVPSSSSYQINDISPRGPSGRGSIKGPCSGGSGAFRRPGSKPLKKTNPLAVAVGQVRRKPRKMWSCRGRSFLKIYYFYHTTSWCGTQTADRIQRATQPRLATHSSRPVEVRFPKSFWFAALTGPRSRSGPGQASRRTNVHANAAFVLNASTPFIAAPARPRRKEQIRPLLLGTHGNFKLVPRVPSTTAPVAPPAGTRVVHRINP
jgi:hypothetical protein